MTHAELVNRAGQWLRNSAVVPCSFSRGGRRRVKCGVVLRELVTSASEIPDAIGWYLGGRFSILVECKISRADFLRDQKKWTRGEVGSEFGLGVYRYYLAPRGLLSVDEMPERWGLLESDGRRIIVSQLSGTFERSLVREMTMLWSECRRWHGGEYRVEQPEFVI